MPDDPNEQPESTPDPTEDPGMIEEPDRKLEADWNVPDTKGDD